MNKISIFLELEQEDIPEQLNDMKNVRHLKVSGGNPLKRWMKHMLCALFSHRYKFNFTKGELESRECERCGQIEYPLRDSNDNIIEYG